MPDRSLVDTNALLEDDELNLPPSKDEAAGEGVFSTGSGESIADTGERERIRGIFSTQSVQKIGTGTTVRRTIQKTFWMVQELDDGQVETQPLNVNYIPSGPKRKIPLEDLLQKFSPEPEFYLHSVFPAMQGLNKTIDKGEEHRKNGELFSAENEFKEALKVDVENVRANFGLGLTYLDREEVDKAEDIFQRLVKLDATFEPDHKHLFNEFGIKLRKNRMYGQAMEYYQRAEELTTGDENLLYNMARALFEMGDNKKAGERLATVLSLNPSHPQARKFHDWLVKNGMISDTAAPAGDGGGKETASAAPQKASAPHLDDMPLADSPMGDTPPSSGDEARPPSSDYSLDGILDDPGPAPKPEKAPEKKVTYDDEDSFVNSSDPYKVD